MAKRDDSQIKGWTFLTGDLDWAGVGAMWCRKAKDGSWYVLKFENMREHDSKAVESGEWDEFSCEVKRLDLNELSRAAIFSALESSGFRREPLEDGGYNITNSHDGAFVCGPDKYEWFALECCIQHGLGAPLHAETGKGHPIQVRGRARRVAEELMRDATRLETALDRPVNRIGSTAREYGLGDIDSALNRGPFDQNKQLARRLSGLEPSPEAALQGATVRVLKQSDLQKCKFFIINPAHYRDDGSCMCDDAEHRKMMIEAWEYTEEDFKDIPLRAP